MLLVVPSQWVQPTRWSAWYNAPRSVNIIPNPSCLHNTEPRRTSFWAHFLPKQPFNHNNHNHNNNTMDSDSSFHYPSSFFNDEDKLNNTHNGSPFMEQQSDDSSIASSSSNGPATFTAPPNPPEALKLKKLQCCDLFLHTFKCGQLYQSPLALQAAIVNVAKQFYFFICSRAMRNYTRKAGNPSACLKDTKTFKVNCPFRISFNFANRKLKYEVTEADKKLERKLEPLTGSKSHSFVLCIAPNANYIPLNCRLSWKKGGHLSIFEFGQIVFIINMVNNRAGKFGSNELREDLQPLFLSEMCQAKVVFVENRSNFEPRLV